MSKIASYLQEHIQGEVLTDPKLRAAVSTDASLLTLTPEMVIYPRATSDIRKAARFSWQLAEKGHILSLTARGGGSDQTGAAIGSGVILDLSAHLHEVFELDAKQKLVRVQPGANFQALSSALGLHGLGIPSAPASAGYSTIGGAVANNASGYLSGRYGDTRKWVSQLEVVLASGDVLQTERLSKRELNRRKGLQTFEGEIYRQIDGLITDNQQLINDKLVGQDSDNAGYRALADVKHRDGSIDLTPLFVGSQGTLGIISEIIMKAEFVNKNIVAIAACFPTIHDAHDAVDGLLKLTPSFMELFDGELFADAAKKGKSYSFYADASQQGSSGAILLLGFDDFSSRARGKKLKKALKFLGTTNAHVSSASDEQAQALLSAREVTAYAISSDGEWSSPPLLDGAHIPLNRLDDFLVGVQKLSEKHHVSLPVFGHILTSVYSIRPKFQLRKVSDKQKVFKLLSDYAELVSAHGGDLVSQAGEGRLKSVFVRHELDADIVALYDAVKLIFDPYGILNPGVKQDGDVRKLAASLRTSYDLTRFDGHSPYA